MAVNVENLFQKSIIITYKHKYECTSSLKSEADEES